LESAALLACQQSCHHHGDLTPHAGLNISPTIRQPSLSQILDDKHFVLHLAYK